MTSSRLLIPTVEQEIGGKAALGVLGHQFSSTCPAMISKRTQLLFHISKSTPPKKSTKSMLADQVQKIVCVCGLFFWFLFIFI